MAYKPTPEQEKIINSDAAMLLVPASAGSGKTGVMTDRIARLICDGKVELSGLLVITFTKAAAAEMKERLFDKLSVLAGVKTELYRKLAFFDNAAIGTIHSFCSEIIKAYFYVAEIDPAFSVMEETQSIALKKQVIDGVFEMYHKSGDILFAELSEMFGKRTDQGFRDEIIAMARFAECTTDFSEYLEKSTRSCDCSRITQRLQYCFEFFREKAFKLRDEAYILGGDFTEKVNSMIIEARLEGAFPDNVLQAAERMAALPTLRLSAKDKQKEGAELFKEKFKTLKGAWSKAYGKYVKYIESASGELSAADEKAFPYVKKLLEVFDAFSKEYGRIKYKKGILDFSDLERLALKVMQNKDASEQIRRKFKYVFVDEYQDVNDVQEKLIQEIGCKSSMFLVGDLKQSIYGFRMSDPLNFLRRKQRAENCILPLTVNFRSHKGILEFVNHLFGSIMTERFGGSEYKTEARLSGKRATEGAFAPVNILYYDEKYDETQAIVSTIKRLIGTYVKGEGAEYTIAPGSIAVLARTKKDLVGLYNRLRAEGIPVSLCYDQELYGGTEIRTLVSLLSVIDNPMDDLHLYASLVGFFGKLSADELADIRLAAPDVSLYTAAKQYPSQKTQGFFAFLDELRLAAASMPADKLVGHIARISDYRSYLLTLPDGVARCDILDSFLLSINGKPESKELSSLLDYLRESELKGNVDAYNDGDSIKLTTVHAAKGLEYPVVFLCAQGRSFNKRCGEVLCDKENGVAMKYYNKQDKSVEPTARYLENRDNYEYKIAEEELRLLYVAMTRAKDMLFIALNAEAKPSDMPFFCASNAEDWILSALEGGAKAERHEVRQSDEPPCESREIVFGNPSDSDWLKIKKRLEYRYPFIEETEVPMKVTATGISKYGDDSEVSGVYEMTTRFEHLGSEKAALRGTAYHKALENLPLGMSDTAQIEQALNGLVVDGVLSNEEKALILPRKLAKTLGDPKLTALLDGARVYREAPFLAQLPFGALAQGKSNTPTILQGVIDLIAIWKDRAVILDFKYTSDLRTLAKYVPQLNAYKKAAQLILKKDNVKALLYSVSTNELFDLQALASKTHLQNSENNK